MQAFVQAFVQTFVQAFRDDYGNVRTDDYIGNCGAIPRDGYRDVYKDNYKTSSAALAGDALVFTQILEARSS